MALLNPLPFRLKLPDEEAIGLGGVKSVSYRVDGLLHLSDQSLTLEWSGTQTTEQVSFEKIGTDVDELPEDWLELPIEQIAGARVIGGWWRPRLELRARRLNAFEGVPTARGATLCLRIHLRDRGMAQEMAEEIGDLAETALEELEDHARLRDPDSGW